MCLPILNGAALRERVVSYNITRWRTKTVDRLRIPVEALYANPDRSWQPKARVRLADGSHRIELTESGFIDAIIVDDVAEVRSIVLQGEASGHMWHETLKPALERSTGRLEAVRIWEGGDYVDRLTVVDGTVTETETDL